MIVDGKEVKIAPAQCKAIDMMKEFEDFKSSYSLQIGLNTLEALHGKGVVDKKVGRGVMFCPRTAISFRLKDQWR